MLTTVAALGTTVALALAYRLVTERMDYGSLSRRQLDAWVFVAGLGCLSLMVYGGADVHRAELEVGAALPGIPEGATVIERRATVALVSAGGPAQGPLQPAPVGAWTEPDENTEPEPPPVGVDAAGAASTAYVFLRRVPTPTAPAQSVAAQAVAGEELVSARGAYTPSMAARSPELLPPVAGPIVVVPPTERAVVVPTDEPPPPTATAPPSPWATPTPFCGQPGDIVLDLDVLDASMERVAGQLAVRYRAQVYNRSTFPVRLVDLTVTLEGRDSGSERFGRSRLGDVQIEPSVVHAIEGTMVLDKSPSPFGSTQLCVSLVAETCGRSLPYHSTKRCVAARGF